MTHTEQLEAEIALYRSALIGTVSALVMCRDYMKSYCDAPNTTSNASDAIAAAEKTLRGE